MAHLAFVLLDAVVNLFVLSQHRRVFERLIAKTTDNGSFAFALEQGRLERERISEASNRVEEIQTSAGCSVGVG